MSPLIKIPVILFTVCLGIPAVRANATDTSSTSPSYVIDAEDAAGPWGTADGRGCGNRIVRAAFEQTRTPVKLVVLPYARCKTDVLAGMAHGCYSMSFSSDLLGRVVFSREPIYSVRALIVSTRSDAVSIEQIKDLPANRTIGIVNGYEYPLELVKYLGLSKDVKTIQDEETILRMLQDHRLDYGVLMIDKLKSVDFLSAQAHINKSHLKVIYTSKEQNSYIGFSLLDENGIKLKLLFDEGHQELIKSGQKDKIIKECQQGHL